MFGFNVSVSGARVGMRRLDVSANNLANATTPAFKSSRVHSVDQQQGGASVGAVQVNVQPGPLDITEGGLSIAIDGAGYFRVQTPQGDRFTRAGVFNLDANRNIVTPNGHPLSPGFQVPQDATSIHVSPSGTVSAQLANGQVEELGQIDLVRFANPNGLSQEGGNLLSTTPASGDPINGGAGEVGIGRLIFGAAEGSNVNLTDEVVSQIVSSASVKANLTAIKTRDEILGTVIDLAS